MRFCLGRSNSGAGRSRLHARDGRGHVDPICLARAFYRLWGVWIGVRTTECDRTALDERIQSRLRLAAMTIPATVERVEYSIIRDQVRATDGNLASHLRKLEDAGYVAVRKRIVDCKPRSDYRLTPRGRQALADYLSCLDRMLGRARN